MTFPWLLLIVAYVVCLAATVAGFKRVYYFVSLCYAGAIAAQSVVFGVAYSFTIGGWPLILVALLFAYGVRLGLFLWTRERNPAYAKDLALAERRTADVALWLKVVIWLGVSALYTLLFLPALLSLDANAHDRSLISLPLGTLIAAAGLCIEAVADWQKSSYKAAHPAHYCDTGLYGWVRCPNYLGEMLVWFGVWFAGVSAYETTAAWVLATLGMLYIEILMVGAAANLERKQDERYGALPDYQDYVRTVPILLPYLRLHSLKKLPFSFH